MGRCSATKKSDTFDDYDDPRTQRRLRRMYVRANQYFKPNSSGNAPQRTVKKETAAANQHLKPKSPDDAPQRTVSKETAAANQHLKPKSPGDAPQRTVNQKKQDNEIVMEPHYKEFLDCTVLLSDSGDHSVDFKYTGAGAKTVDDAVNSHHKVILEEISDVSDHDEDPDYKLFLENLREDGKSYALQVFVGNEMSELIKYEEEDWLRDGLKLDTPKTLEGCPANQKTKDKKAQKGISKREMKSTSNNFDNISCREDPKSLRSSRYEMRLENMETLETSNEVPSERRKNSVVKRNANVKQSGHVSGRRKVSSHVGPGSEAIYLAENGKNHEAKFDADESYLLYLDALERDGEEVTSVCQSDSLLRTDEDEKTESLKMTDEDPFGHETYTPFVTSKYYHDPIEVDSCNERLETSNSRFREKLIEILKRPYNSIEYEDSLQEISCRRPIVRDRDLRSGTKSYKSDYISESYLDWCTELSEKIHLARDNRLKTLNLLRGFFYWLQNVSGEGVFRPWLDPECLEVLPQVDNSSSESDE
ncbi:hypothetical protein FNV43_RR12229 [Rhamnella rubrinervis]|uniref:Uncharacterized protein n=1 Tax=Rhamnella rubrinervis TaxID=2594499 RepID=A0A8K0MI29_9ROSA|nr:hypothetical protein FNV43_RR12229 [Rhamnella rubrinervis]